MRPECAVSGGSGETKQRTPAPINTPVFFGSTETHGEIRLVDCQVGPEALIGQEGKGLDYAQLRLGGVQRSVFRRCGSAT